MPVKRTRSTLLQLSPPHRPLPWCSCSSPSLARRRPFCPAAASPAACSDVDGEGWEHRSDPQSFKGAWGDVASVDGCLLSSGRLMAPSKKGAGRTKRPQSFLGGDDDDGKKLISSSESLFRPRRTQKSPGPQLVDPSRPHGPQYDGPASAADGAGPLCPSIRGVTCGGVRAHGGPLGRVSPQPLLCIACSLLRRRRWRFDSTPMPPACRAFGMLGWGGKDLVEQSVVGQSDEFALARLRRQEASLWGGNKTKDNKGVLGKMLPTKPTSEESRAPHVPRLVAYNGRPPTHPPISTHANTRTGARRLTIQQQQEQHSHSSVGRVDRVEPASQSDGRPRLEPRLPAAGQAQPHQLHQVHPPAHRQGQHDPGLLLRPERALNDPRLPRQRRGLGCVHGCSCSCFVWFGCRVVHVCPISGQASPTKRTG